MIKIDDLVEGKVLKTRDRVGGTITTDLYKLKNGSYIAYSSYSRDKDELIVGRGEGTDEAKTVKMSRKDLRIQWKKDSSNID